MPQKRCHVPAGVPWDGLFGQDIKENRPMQQIKARRESWPSTQEEVDAWLSRSIRLSVAEHICEVYGGVVEEKLPPRIAELLRQLDS
jgi:hypothetical protein